MLFCFDLNHAFRVLGGAPHRGLYDNMKTAVDRIGRGKARTVNARFSAMTSHYLFEPTFFTTQLRAERRGKSRRAYKIRGGGSGKTSPRSNT